MKNVWNIFRSDWRRITSSVVAVVVLLGLCLVPCLYAWFNILSNWDPYGPASTSRIKVAVASEDDGCEVVGLHVNIGELVLQGLESNDQMGWVFVDDAEAALGGVESGEYYAALVVPHEFTGDFVSILSGELRHPQIQYYENEKKNAIAPKITSKAKTAVQEQINTTVIGKVADALTTAGSVFKAMGWDGQDIADNLLGRLEDAQQQMTQLNAVLVSLKDVMDGAESLLDAAAITIGDARDTMDSGYAAAGSTVHLIDTGLSAADETGGDLLTVLDNTYKVLDDVDALLRAADTSAADAQMQAQLHQQLQTAIAALEAQAAATTDPEMQAQLETTIADLRALDAAVDDLSIAEMRGPVLDAMQVVREDLRMAALKTNQAVNDYLHTTGAEAQGKLRALQQLLAAASASLNSVDSSLYAYADAVATTQPTLDAAIALTTTVNGYLADMEDDLRRITDSGAFQRFCELMESDSGHMADYLSSPVQLNTEIIYEIKDYGSAMAPYYVMLALFVGSLLTAVMIKVPVTQKEFAGCPAIQRYFGRFTVFFLMAMAQALVTAFGCLHFVGMTVAEPALFVVGCCVCSLNFAAMNYALVYALDNVGMAASVIIMVLQVAGSGGSYPVHVLPELFQRLYPVMPFHYGMDMLRETIGGMYGQTYLRCAAILLGMCVVFTAFGLVVYYPARRLNKAIAEGKEKSGIM